MVVLPSSFSSTAHLWTTATSSRTSRQCCCSRGGSRRRAHRSASRAPTAAADVAPRPLPLQQQASSSGGLLQLQHLSSPDSMQEAWQAAALPACLGAWQELAQEAAALAQGTAAEQEQLLQRLDALLGTCQQVLLVTALLKDHAAQRAWRSAAASVFVEARTLEQEVCSDVRLQQALLLCRASGQQGGAASGRLCRSLLKHMQLEALHPGAFAVAAAAGCDTAAADVNQQRLPEQPEVLSAGEQAALLSGLRIEHRALSSRMQALLADGAAAPVVQLDADSRRVVLAPLLQDPAAAASPAEDAEALALTLPLVTQLLQRHPDAAVRAEVYAAGLLTRLDGLLALWRELGEVRRKIGRMQGGHSYADVVLQHSLLGSPAAAAAFCGQLAAALQPGAEAAVAALQQEGAALAGSDLPHHMHEAQRALLSADDLRQLQPYLQLPAVLAGFSKLLQLLLGVSLTHRQPAGQESWAPHVLVYELHECRASASAVASQQQQQQRHAAAVSGGGRLLGTVYLDTSGGFSAQLLTYGRQYAPCAHHAAAQQQQHGSSQDSSSSRGSFGGTGAAPAVAVGLQSGGVLCGDHEQLSLGLWELCHELGHAVHFVLSAARGTSSSSDSQPDSSGEAAAASHSRCFHDHAAWLPTEVLELPSTLFEAFAMDPVALQLLCGSSSSRSGQQQPLHADLAARLAAFMRQAHYNAAAYQHTVLAMLFDVQQSDLSSRQLGRHAAHHAWGATMQELSAMRGVELTLQQVRCVPRLLQASSQGHGYAVAWALAQLLQPPLLRHLHAGASAAAGAQVGSQQQQQLWRRLLSAGSELADAVWLAEAVVALQEAAAHGDEAPAAGRLLPLLRAQQLWPLSPASDRQQVLAAVLAASLEACERHV